MFEEWRYQCRKFCRNVNFSQKMIREVRNKTVTNIGGLENWFDLNSFPFHSNWRNIWTRNLPFPIKTSWMNAIFQAKWNLKILITTHYHSRQYHKSWLTKLPTLLSRSSQVSDCWYREILERWRKQIKVWSQLSGAHYNLRSKYYENIENISIEERGNTDCCWPEVSSETLHY